MDVKRSATGLSQPCCLAAPLGGDVGRNGVLTLWTHHPCRKNDSTQSSISCLSPHARSWPRSPASASPMNQDSGHHSAPSCGTSLDYSHRVSQSPGGWGVQRGSLQMQALYILGLCTRAWCMAVSGSSKGIQMRGMSREQACDTVWGRTAD